MVKERLGGAVRGVAVASDPLPVVMREVTAPRDEIQRLFAALGTPSTAAEARSVAQAMATQARYHSAFTQLRGAADQLAAEQTQWSATAERLDTLAGELDSALRGSVGSAQR